MRNIFISYSRENQAVVEALASDLVSMGHTVWFDQRLKGGQEWWNEILDQIRLCNLFVFSLSPGIQNSRACELEFKYASALGKPILPILVADNVSMQLFPEAISKTQYVDYRKRDKDALLKLLNALQELPPAKPMPWPLPEPPSVPISYIEKLKDEIVTPKTLSFSEQTEIVTKLKHRLAEANEQADIRYLLLEFRKRDDLYAKVGQDIDDLLSKIPVQANRTPQVVPYKKPEPYQPPGTQPHNSAQLPTNTPQSKGKGLGIVALVVIGLIILVCVCSAIYSVLFPPCYGYYC